MLEMLEQSQKYPNVRYESARFSWIDTGDMIVFRVYKDQEQRDER